MKKMIFNEVNNRNNTNMCEVCSKLTIASFWCLDY